MEAAALFSALADPARRRLVVLLAERPRPVGVLAGLAEARQPQTTKHLQALERAGLVTSQRSGQRRVYALRPAALRELAAILVALADAAEQAAGATFDRYGLSLHAERIAAEKSGWADGRSFRFLRSVEGRPESVWRHDKLVEVLATDSRDSDSDTDSGTDRTPDTTSAARAPTTHDTEPRSAT